MTSREPDMAVIGSGPNGLVAACVLAQRGYGVLVLEQNPKRPGGAVRSDALTLPGFVHDVGATCFPWARSSPALAALDLPSLGVEWLAAPATTCHLAPNGDFTTLSRALVGRENDLTAEQDAQTWRRLAIEFAAIEPEWLALGLETAPLQASLRRLGIGRAFGILPIVRARASSLGKHWFARAAAQGVLAGLTAQLGVSPRDRHGAVYGYFLAMAALTAGYAVPRGGAQSVTNALVTRLERSGGRLLLGTQVSRVLVSAGRVSGVELEAGGEISVRRGVLVGAGEQRLLQDLADRRVIPRGSVSRHAPDPQALGIYKVDWALSAPVPWTVAAARLSVEVHTNADLPHVERSARQALHGDLPETPCLVVVQPTLADPSRAPSDQHTLACRVRVPRWSAGGWEQLRETFADRIEEQIETWAPGFRRSILSRHVATPPDLQGLADPRIGGIDTTVAPNWTRGLGRRLLSPGAPYRTPIRGLYLCSSATHPGPGTHGMCGHNAALTAARDLG